MEKEGNEQFKAFCIITGKAKAIEQESFKHLHNKMKG